MPLLRIAFIFFGILGSIIPACASLLFEDFEVGDLSGWTLNGQSSNMKVSTLYTHSGNFSFQSTLSNTGGYRDASAYAPFNTPLTEPIFFGFYFYIPTTLFSISPGCQVRLGGLIETTSWKSYNLTLKNKAGNLVLGSDLTPDGTHPLIREAWHFVELKYDVHSAQAIVYLDGQVEMTASSLALTTMTNVDIGLNSGDAGAYGSFFFDDVYVGSTDFGYPHANIAMRHANPFAHTSIKLDISLFGQRPSDQLTVSLGNTDLYRKENNLLGREYAIIPLTSLKAGGYPLTVTLLDSIGNQKVVFKETLSKQIDSISPVSIDAENNILVNGSKVFPITPFLLNACSSTEMQSCTGFWFKNGYATYNGWQSGFAPTYSASQYEAYVNAVGIRTIGPDLARWANYNGTIQQQNASIAAYTSTMKNNPNIFMWTWVDEPEINGVSSATLINWTTTSHASDPYHPVAVNLYGYSPNSTKSKGYLFPNQTADVYSFDVYPIGTQFSFATWAAYIDLFQKWSFNLTPWFIIVETSSSKKTLNALQQREEAWLSVIHGAKGVTWYHPDGTTPAQNLSEIADFVTKVKALESILTAPLTNRLVETNAIIPGYRVDVMVKEDDKNIWVFAARLTDDIANPAEATYPPLNTKITISGINNNDSAIVFSEKRSLTISNGQFTDLFSPYSVHIYQISKHTLNVKYNIRKSIPQNKINFSSGTNSNFRNHLRRSSKIKIYDLRGNSLQGKDIKSQGIYLVQSPQDGNNSIPVSVLPPSR